MYLSGSVLLKVLDYHRLRLTKRESRGRKSCSRGRPGVLSAWFPAWFPANQIKGLNIYHHHTRLEHHDRELPITYSSRPRILRVGLDWIGLDWFGLHWIGLDGIELGWAGLDCDWIGLGRIGLGLSSKPSLASVAFFSGSVI